MYIVGSRTHPGLDLEQPLVLDLPLFVIFGMIANIATTMLNKMGESGSPHLLWQDTERERYNKRNLMYAIF